MNFAYGGMPSHQQQFLQMYHPTQYQPIPDFPAMYPGHFMQLPPPPSSMAMPPQQTTVTFPRLHQIPFRQPQVMQPPQPQAPPITLVQQQPKPSISQQSSEVRGRDNFVLSIEDRQQLIAKYHEEQRQEKTLGKNVVSKQQKKKNKAEKKLARQLKALCAVCRNGPAAMNKILCERCAANPSLHICSKCHTRRLWSEFTRQARDAGLSNQVCIYCNKEDESHRNMKICVVCKRSEASKGKCCAQCAENPALQRCSQCRMVRNYNQFTVAGRGDGPANQVCIFCVKGVLKNPKAAYVEITHGAQQDIDPGLTVHQIPVNGKDVMIVLDHTKREGYWVVGEVDPPEGTVLWSSVVDKRGHLHSDGRSRSSSSTSVEEEGSVEEAVSVAEESEQEDEDEEEVEEDNPLHKKHKAEPVSPPITHELQHSSSKNNERSSVSGSDVIPFFVDTKPLARQPQIAPPSEDEEEEVEEEDEEALIVENIIKEEAVATESNNNNRNNSNAVDTLETDTLLCVSDECAAQYTKLKIGDSLASKCVVVKTGRISHGKGVVVGKEKNVSLSSKGRWLVKYSSLDGHEETNVLPFPEVGAIVMSIEVVPRTTELWEEAIGMDPTMFSVPGELQMTGPNILAQCKCCKMLLPVISTYKIRQHLQSNGHKSCAQSKKVPHVLQVQQSNAGCITLPEWFGTEPVEVTKYYPDEPLKENFFKLFDVVETKCMICNMPVGTLQWKSHQSGVRHRDLEKDTLPSGTLFNLV